MQLFDNVEPTPARGADSPLDPLTSGWVSRWEDHPENPVAIGQGIQVPGACLSIKTPRDQTTLMGPPPAD